MQLEDSQNNSVKFLPIFTTHFFFLNLMVKINYLLNLENNNNDV